MKWKLAGINKITLIFIGLGLTGLFATSLIKNEDISGDYALGIILRDGSKIEKILGQIKVRVEPCKKDEGNECKTLVFENANVKVYAIGTEEAIKKLGDFPLSGSLAGDIKNPEERLIQMMEEQGNDRYKIIKE